LGLKVIFIGAKIGLAGTIIQLRIIIRFDFEIVFDYSVSATENASPYWAGN
jgi:hypothetical protein